MVSTLSVYFFLVFIVQHGQLQMYPFRNTSLPWDVRVKDLVSRLTIEEIVVQMSRGGSGPRASPAPAIPRLGIGPFSWNTECLRGDVYAGNATSFPQSLGLAATFSTDVICDVAEATSIEVRAKYNDYQRRKIYGDHKGISCFSPVINIMRHPLWGRNQETYGEDPFLSGEIAKSFVKCLQGDNPTYIRANAGCKHFDVHGGPENIPVSRFSFDAKVSERDWRLTFLPAFKKCVQAGSYSLMCSFNRINGVPACGNKRLLTDILRREWGFTGYVVSDQEAIENIMTYHHYTNNSIDTATLCVKAGCNLELSTNEVKPTYFYINDALKAGKLNKEEVLESVSPLFYTRMRLGEFDPPEHNPYNFLDLSVIQSEEHRSISLAAAMKSFVLLKNKDGFLPITKVYKKISVLGPMADNKYQQIGSYAPDVMPGFTTTPLQGLSKLSKSVQYAAGCTDNACTTYNRSDIQRATNSTDVVFICLGTGPMIENEDHDRGSMELPGKQSQLIKDALSFSANTVPIVLLLFNGGPVNITWADQNDRVVAIIECFFPAQETGEAVWKVLTNTGNFSNPAARLPYTWQKYSDQIPSMVNYSMVNRTYRYFHSNPLYPFGYGLSYSKFRYTNAWMNPVIDQGQNLTVRVEVHNTGPLDGEEVIQIYLKWLDTKEEMPMKQLVGFRRVFLQSGETLSWLFTIDAESMAVWSNDRDFSIEPGHYRLYIGGQQPNQEKEVPSNVLVRDFKIVPNTSYM
ncbi:xylan 1,4-beta-xylosidase-like [Saccostrea echinata]|uniref:xylan 1,4-beta-xylosidase-like n=1 Tax=Saccostrea echinata TaxID=191078 RepID=UPI002A7FF4F1|nr:xylan 1,4-beta-xylosidase-like [Saccostrea echinata]